MLHGGRGSGLGLPPAEDLLVCVSATAQRRPPLIPMKRGIRRDDRRFHKESTLLITRAPLRQHRPSRPPLPHRGSPSDSEDLPKSIAGLRTDRLGPERQRVVGRRQHRRGTPSRTHLKFGCSWQCVAACGRFRANGGSAGGEISEVAIGEFLTLPTNKNHLNQFDGCSKSGSRE